MLLQEIQFPTPGEVILDCRQPISVAVTKDRGSKFRTRQRVSAVMGQVVA
jgi:hypothetical protein